jgi:hypothetical protein
VPGLDRRAVPMSDGTRSSNVSPFPGHVGWSVEAGHHGSAVEAGERRLHDQVDRPARDDLSPPEARAGREAPPLTPCAAGGGRLIISLVPVATVTRPWESGISWRVSLETRPHHQ